VPHDVEDIAVRCAAYRTRVVVERRLAPMYRRYVWQRDL